MMLLSSVVFDHIRSDLLLHDLKHWFIISEHSSWLHDFIFFLFCVGFWSYVSHMICGRCCVCVYVFFLVSSYVKRTVHYCVWLCMLCLVILVAIWVILLALFWEGLFLLLYRCSFLDYCGRCVWMSSCRTDTVNDWVCVYAYYQYYNYSSSEIERICKYLSWWWT
jgi:hypothetical protein